MVEDVLILFCERLGEHIHLRHLTILVGIGSPEEIYQPVEVKGVLMVDLSCGLEIGVFLQMVFMEVEQKQAVLESCVIFRLELIFFLSPANVKPPFREMEKQSEWLATDGGSFLSSCRVYKIPPLSCWEEYHLFNS